jgi:hypothetical protein
MTERQIKGGTELKMFLNVLFLDVSLASTTCLCCLAIVPLERKQKALILLFPGHRRAMRSLESICTWCLAKLVMSRTRTRALVSGTCPFLGCLLKSLV